MFLRDGLAEVIAGGLAQSSAPIPRPEAADLVEYFADGFYNELRSALDRSGRLALNDQLGRFARTMIDELSLARFLEFYRRSSRDRDRWVSETGRSLEEWAALAVERTPELTIDRSYRLPLAECAAAPIVSGKAAFGQTLQGPSFYAPRVANHLGGARAFSFELRETSDVTVRVVAPNQPFFALESCAGPGEASFARGVGYEATSEVVEERRTLAPGRYFLIAGASAGAAPPDTFKVLLTEEAQE